MRHMLTSKYVMAVVVTRKMKEKFSRDSLLNRASRKP